MISLTSTWPLKDGCPPALQQALRDLAAQVRAKEPGTWMYLVHLQAPWPLGKDNDPLDPPPAPIAMKEQKEVVFVEVYADAEALAAHLRGKPYNDFLKANIRYFVEDPNNPGLPNFRSAILERESGCFSFPQAGSEPGGGR